MIQSFILFLLNLGRFAFVGPLNFFFFSYVFLLPCYHITGVQYLSILSVTNLYLRTWLSTCIFGLLVCVVSVSVEFFSHPKFESKTLKWEWDSSPINTGTNPCWSLPPIFSCLPKRGNFFKKRAIALLLSFISIFIATKQYL